MEISDKVFRRKIETLYPEIASKVTEDPRLTDLSKVPELYDLFCDNIGESKGAESHDFRTLFVGIVLRLYDPDYLLGFRKRVKEGLRSEIAKVFRIEDDTVSWWISQVSGRLRIYKNISDSVDSLSGILADSLR